jgi:hypothetical protein
MLIFLDIDGVMVLAKSWSSPELLNDGFPAFSSKATAALQSILSEGATIVLTTSHKKKYSPKEWKQIFKRRGINVTKLKSLGANLDNLNRIDEITRWLNKNNLSDKFVIIDDDKSLNSLPANLKSHLILTNPMVGLTKDHVEEIKSFEHSNY